ncbi:MAG: LysE/ArgO family amino acid transporter [Psychromonas sp.]
MDVYFSGLFLSFSLIIAIGPQNAFVLKQGLQRQHVFAVCAICAISDALLILVGVLGFAELINSFDRLEEVARYGGALFLTLYGIHNLHSAWKEKHSLKAKGKVNLSLPIAVLTCLAFTWLNPHVYLDTVVLMGTISSQYEEQKYTFALGAISASFIFFFSLGYGARALTPIFLKPIAWKVLEIIIGLTMIIIAITLLL